MDKVFEKLLPARLEKELESASSFFRHKFGLVKLRSTIDPIGEGVSAAQKSKDTKSFCAVITLDIRNAFNPMNRAGIIKCLNKRKFDTRYSSAVDIISGIIFMLTTFTILLI